MKFEKCVNDQKNCLLKFFNNEINRPTTASQTLLESTPAAYDPLDKMVPKIAFSKFGKKVFLGKKNFRFAFGGERESTPGRHFNDLSYRAL